VSGSPVETGRPPLLQVRDLRVSFPTAEGRLPAVRGIDLDLEPGGTLGLVGESGSGKSVSMLAVMGLLPPRARLEGSIRFCGQELVGAPASALRRLRGSRLGMVFQDPMTSLNPVLKVGDQIAEALRVHQDLSRPAAKRRAIELLDLVAIPNPVARVESYPFELSGGMRQRVMIAMAMANEPDVLIADEPTTALDVTIQAQILEVLDRLRRERGIGVVLITHDLGVVARTVDRVAVMYAGRIVEQGSVFDLFAEPRHPYTQGLLACLPNVDDPRSELTPIAGSPPSLVGLPPGCAFEPRCPHRVAACSTVDPGLRRVGRSDVACHVAPAGIRAGATTRPG
jgi:oligopeptide/dipeptide ABC transporter ATP-binding protein